MLIENTVQIVDFMKSESQEKAGQREWNTGEDQEREHDCSLASQELLRTEDYRSQK